VDHPGPQPGGAVIVSCHPLDRYLSVMIGEESGALQYGCRRRDGVVGRPSSRGEPLRPGDLEHAGEQTMVWDGRDDAGDSLAGAGFSARLEAGGKQLLVQPVRSL
jgi:hypothetical protein